MAQTTQSVAAELSQAEIARRLGMSRSYLNKIMQGERNPSLDLARDIATEMGVTLDEFWEIRQEARTLELVA
jgi:transcriptional regulator with XRE-family HTH domain